MSSAASASVFSGLPGLSEDEYPGFPADVCPEILPDLHKHHSLLADLFKREPGLYEQLRQKRTALGVGLAKCIKTGMDNRGHPMIKTLGIVAGDAECYEVFRPLFDALIRERACSPAPGSLSLSAADRRGSGSLTTTCPDDSGGYVLSTQVRAARCLEGVRFPPAASLEERREVERVVSRALLELKEPLKGKYFPLVGSQSYSQMPGGMSESDEEVLAQEGLLFSHPDSTAVLCSGVGRHWPDARGIFVNDSRNFSVWLNEEEHVRAVAVCKGCGAQAAFTQLANALDGVAESLRRHGDGPTGFAHNERLGFLTSCPTNLGTALRVSVIMQLPLLSRAQDGRLGAWCQQRRLVVRGAIDQGGFQLKGVLEVSNRDRLGISEVETVNLVVEAVAELVKAEQRLERGEPGLQDETAPVAASLPEELPRRESALTPIPSETDEVSWEVAGKTLGILFARAVVSTEVPPAETPAETPAPKAEAETPACDYKSQEEAAAVKIQALRRGNTTRLSLASAKAEAATAAEVPAKGEEAACRDLGPVMEEADKGFAEIKKRAADLLCSSAETGALKKALETVATEAGLSTSKPTGSMAQETQMEPTIEEVRMRMKKELEDSLDNGSLLRLLSSSPVTAEGSLKDAPRMASLEEIKAKTAQLLKDSCVSGTLAIALEKLHKEEAAQVARPEPEALPDIQEIKARAKDILYGAAESGALRETLLATQASPDPGQVSSMEESQAAVKIQAIQRGKMTRRATAEKLEVKQEKKDIEDVRLRMQTALEEALDDGSLSRLLSSRPSSRTEAAPSAPPKSCDETEAWGARSDAIAEVAEPSAPPKRSNDTEQAIEAQRERMRGLLEVALDDGRLEAALNSQLQVNSGKVEAQIATTQAEASQAPEEPPREVDINAIRLRMGQVLQASADDGTLEELLRNNRASPSPPPPEPAEPNPPPPAAPAPEVATEAAPTTSEPVEDDGLEHILDKVRTGLQDCFSTGRLEDWLKNGGLQAETPVEQPATSTEVKAPAPTEKAIEDVAGITTVAKVQQLGPVPVGAQALLEAVSSCDRKIGLLQATILEVERRILGSTQHAETLEAELQAAKRESHALDMDIEAQQRAIDDAEAHHWRLQENQRKLVDDIEVETLKQRHALVDLDAGFYTARSELSTACTMLDLSTTRTDDDPVEPRPVVLRQETLC